MKPYNESTTQLIEPYGGKLINLLVADEEREDILSRAAMLPRIQLTLRNLCDLELLATGAFSPLKRFLGREDYLRVLAEMRLADGTLFPIPITLAVDARPDIGLGAEIALADQHNDLLAIMRVEEMYQWDLEEEAQLAYGTTDPRHPLVAELHTWGKLYISGELRVLALPKYHDFRRLRLTPLEVRRKLSELGQPRVVAFQTRNPLHRAHEELTKRAAQQIDGALLLHPVVGMTKAGDIDHYTRVQSYIALASKYYDSGSMMLALLPLAMRMAGAREAVWHAIIRRNFGANHFIIGRDHASPGGSFNQSPFYGPYDAQTLMSEHSAEVGVQPILFSEMIYLPDEDRYEESSLVRKGQRVASISGTRVREDYLQRGRPLPTWFSRPEVASILATAYPPRHRQGFCLWFTGLSGSGKSTTADILTIMLLEKGRQVTVLDGDVIRTHLSKGLSFSKEDREINVRRIGFVASEVVRHGGGVICAAISPYSATRNECRTMIGNDRFIEIFVDTPLDVCEQRDPKGMYALARDGQLTGFTGIDDPYEPPHNPEITIDTVRCSAQENTERIVSYLIDQGFVRPSVYIGDADPEIIEDEEELVRVS
ncbi:MAG TPA: bifunctional sulfate adenylyltransferase/adenylylsulfate kinase [Pyrinomonadaceae bacterium]|nr:bifunctional sulfate adenylyltransferase/adenylylsulfate kinase [Pyrinomonadaceae bacterium]